MFLFREGETDGWGFFLGLYSIKAERDDGLFFLPFFLSFLFFLVYHGCEKSADGRFSWIVILSWAFLGNGL